MLKDRYDNDLSTSSESARSEYIKGVDLLLSANPGAEEAFRKAIDADEAFALAHVSLARTLQAHGRGGEAKPPLARARELASSVTDREKSHIKTLGLVIEGKGVEGLAATRVHIQSWPRDTMVLAPSTSVFGLIGFSGLAGREEEQLALLEPLATKYGDDWWFRTVLAFAEIETGRTDRGLRNIDLALSAFPRNAHGAHIRAHLYYELGERLPGLNFLKGWSKDYPREGQIHCHINWHVALWELELGQSENAWSVYRASLHPGAAWGPQINVLTDCASFLFRAELAGEPRRPELWRDLSRYAETWFPNPGLAFADVHGALAHAMAEDEAALARIVDGARGPAADIVSSVARGFGAFADRDWNRAISELQSVLQSHERIGGSRAQRDLVEYAMAAAMVRAGRKDDARRLVAERRPRNGTGGFPLAEL